MFSAVQAESESEKQAANYEGDLGFPSAPLSPRHADLCTLSWSEGGRTISPRRSDATTWDRPGAIVVTSRDRMSQSERAPAPSSYLHFREPGSHLLYWVMWGNVCKKADLDPATPL